MKKQIVLPITLAAMLAGCNGTNNSPVGLVDVNRIVANWTTYQKYQQQLLADEQRIAQGKGSAVAKSRAARQLQAKYAGITDQLTKQIRDAASKVAADKQLKLVVTKEGVGYGGVDITPDVEKSMNITETASPSPT